MVAPFDDAAAAFIARLEFVLIGAKVILLAAGLEDVSDHEFSPCAMVDRDLAPVTSAAAVVAARGHAGPKVLGQMGTAG